MRRKLIRQKSAYTITLPIRWIREYHLEEASEVEVAEKNASLIVSAEPQTASTREKLRLEKGIADYYRIMIENNYLRGTDELDIAFMDPDAMETIQETVANLIGYEIVEQGKGRCIVRETAMPTAQEVRTIQKRFFNVVLYGHELLLTAVENDAFSDTTAIEQFIRDCRRYSLFCRRAIHKTPFMSRSDEVFLDLLLERVIIAAYHVYYIFTKRSRLEKEPVREEVNKLLRKSLSMFKIFLEMHAKKDTRQFARINDLWQSIYFDEGQRLLADSNEAESIIVFHAMGHAMVVFLISQPNTVLSELP